MEMACFQLQILQTGIILLVIGGACIILAIIGDYLVIRYLVSSGRGETGKYRDGGLESRGQSVQLSTHQNDVPKTPPPGHHPAHPPKTHIIEIYSSKTPSTA